uniref:General transcription factor IIH subunit 4 n=1 Tax=Piliocolobus tephrosceles TaxID=591936 RepID=A0A8C9H6Y7_9PRIM
MGKTRKNIENMEIYDYMKELNEKIWEEFFEDSLAHETILNSLGELEQIIISRLLFIQQVVSERAMRLWINPNYLKKLSECIKNLVDAKILIENKTRKDNCNQYIINEKFRLTLLNKIYKNDENHIFIFNNNIKEQLEKEKKLFEKKLYPSKNEISTYANTKWNNLLHFIASPKFYNNYMSNNNMTNNDADNTNMTSHYSIISYNNKKNSKEKNYEYDPEDLTNNHYVKSKENSSTDNAFNHNDIYSKKKKYDNTNTNNEKWGVSCYKQMYDEESYNNKEYEGHNSSNNSESYEYNNEQYDEQNVTEEEEEEEEYDSYGKQNDQSYNNFINQNKYKNINNNNNIKNVSINEDINKINYDNGYKKPYLNKRKGKKKKKKGVYAFRQNDLYYKSLNHTETEQSYVEEESSNDFFFPNINNNTFYVYTPCDSVVEVLKSKNFILDDTNSTNKTINISREAFSWFLKDIRSRIISLVFEYLLILDNGFVTDFAKEVFAKYRKKKKINGSQSRSSSRLSSQTNSRPSSQANSDNMSDKMKYVSKNINYFNTPVGSCVGSGNTNRVTLSSSNDKNCDKNDDKNGDKIDDKNSNDKIDDKNSNDKINNNTKGITNYNQNNFSKNSKIVKNNINDVTSNDTNNVYKLYEPYSNYNNGHNKIYGNNSYDNNSYDNNSYDNNSYDSSGSSSSSSSNSNSGSCISNNQNVNNNNYNSYNDVSYYCDSCYITNENKNEYQSEKYVKETLLLILSITQCNISHPLFLENLTTAQKEFISFGTHIGLFLKPNNNNNNDYVFTTPYTLLLTINNLHVQHYISFLNELSVDSVYSNDTNNHNEATKKMLTNKHFHSYMLLQEKEKNEKQMRESQTNESELTSNNQLSKDSNTKTCVAKQSINNIYKEKINNDLINQNLYSEKKMNDNTNLEIGLIVQSNFKVYLYTSSILKINILSHLCELQSRTPNMVVGILTRRSVLNAYNSNITADQIIKFLESYARQGSNFKSTIPVNVITQLKLWESERHRLTLDDAIVFKSFEKQFLPHMYQQLVIWANSKNYLLHYTPWPKNKNSVEFDRWMQEEKYLCCTYESKDEIIEKIKELKDELINVRKKT